MWFLVDAQLPPELVGWLTRRGHHAEHVFDLLPPSACDDEVWDLVVRQGAAILTKDEDFIAIRMRVGSGPSVVWLRIGNATNASLFQWLGPRLDGIVAAMTQDTPIVEVR